MADIAQMESDEVACDKVLSMGEVTRRIMTTSIEDLTVFTPTTVNRSVLQSEGVTDIGTHSSSFFVLRPLVQDQATPIKRSRWDTREPMPIR